MMFNIHTYKIQKDNFISPNHIIIFYKNMRIEWRLEEFTPSDVDTITEQIKHIKSIKYSKRTKCFLCKNKWGWNKLEKVLMQHYYLKINHSKLPNDLIYQSLQNFISQKDEWQIFN